MNVGDSVEWTYLHSLNSKSKVKRTKRGIFLGLVKHRKSYIVIQMAKAKFDGNKGVFLVPKDELRKVSSNRGETK